MNNINQYKKRFYNLMESTMGDAKPLIIEGKTPMILNGGTPSPEDPLKYGDRSGFYAISYTSDGIVEKVMNTYDGGSSESERKEFTPQTEGSLNPQSDYIAFSYWLKVTAGQVMTVNMSAVSSNGVKTNQTWSNRGPESKDGVFMGRFNLGPLPPKSNIKITVANDTKNSLTITTK